MLNKICPDCNSRRIITNQRPDTPHYAELRCKDCGRWIEWVKSPQQPRSKSVLKQTKIRDGKCCFCGRVKEQLGTNETFTTDHINELHEGGEDNLKNTWTLCTACDKLKLWMRTYVNRHLQKFYKDENF